MAFSQDDLAVSLARYINPDDEEFDFGINRRVTLKRLICHSGIAKYASIGCWELKLGRNLFFLNFSDRHRTC